MGTLATHGLRPMLLSYRNQSNIWQSKSTDLFLHDREHQPKMSQATFRILVNV